MQLSIVNEIILLCRLYPREKLESLTCLAADSAPVPAVGQLPHPWNPEPGVGLLS